MVGNVIPSKVSVVFASGDLPDYFLVKTLFGTELFYFRKEDFLYLLILM
jgi:hypothetical protein